MKTTILLTACASMFVFTNCTYVEPTIADDTSTTTTTTTTQDHLTGEETVTEETTTTYR